EIYCLLGRGVTESWAFTGRFIVVMWDNYEKDLAECWTRGPRSKKPIPIVTEKRPDTVLVPSKHKLIPAC
ncbi:unnamed protein product, partial [marine sediment metagenome]